MTPEFPINKYTPIFGYPLGYGWRRTGFSILTKQIVSFEVINTINDLQQQLNQKRKDEWNRN